MQKLKQLNAVHSAASSPESITFSAWISTEEHARLLAIIQQLEEANKRLTDENLSLRQSLLQIFDVTSQ